MNEKKDSSRIQAFVEYFQSGCKNRRTGAVGMEVEHFTVRRQDSSAVSYYGPHGIEELLERLSQYFPEKDVKEGHLIALGNEDYVISIEPAAQLEISIAPKIRLQDIAHTYRQFRELLEPIFKEWDYHLVTAGYHLTEKAEDMELIPKKRYQYMDRYFGEIGRFGRCMMRGTASVQGSVDYYSEEDFVRTYRAAVAFAPLFALITDNAPVFQKEPWKKHMVRTFIWEQVDPQRCSVVPGTFEDGFGFAAYARWLYETPAIFQPAGKQEEYVGGKPFKELCRGDGLNRELLEHGVSIVFPDVRLKQYIEIRSGDSMPMEYALSYIALLKGMFVDREALQELYQELEQSTQGGRLQEAVVQDGKRQLMEYGYQGRIYGKTAGYWLERMLALAGMHLEKEEQSYLMPMENLVLQQKSVRDQTAGTE